MTWEFNEGFQVNATLVANQFIDQYMAGANGEYVKVYLYLLRHAGKSLSLGEIAEALHYTEGDVKRAIAYWKKEGVLAGKEMERETLKKEEPVPILRKARTQVLL